MFAKNFVVTFFAGTIAMSLPVFAQEETTVYKNEASVQAFGSFVKSTTSNGVDESATNSGGVLASYRFFFTQHQGVEAFTPPIFATRASNRGDPCKGRHRGSLRAVRIHCERSSFARSSHVSAASRSPRAIYAAAI